MNVANNRSREANAESRRRHGRMRPLVLGLAAAMVTVAGIAAGLPALSARHRIGLLVLAGLLAGLAAGVEARERSRHSPGQSTRAAKEADTPPAEGSVTGPVRRDLFQLPPDVEDFVGRERVLDQITRLLEDRAAQRTAIAIVAIAGKPGVGKTILAVHAAHRLRHRFPDGQLYVNLRGAEAQALDPQEVLAGFLRELGVARAAVPENLEERARLFRARLDKQRVLVVLDNAADEAQVRQLLPGGSGCAVLLTSRSMIAGLAGITPVHLEQLRPEQAVELLARIVGHDRVDMEPEAAAEIVQLCGYLPLAVRIAGSKLASKRHWSLASFARRLGDERNRLGELVVGDLEVRASLALSYDGLNEQERRVFRLLGVLDVPDFPPWISAAILGGDLSAERLVERLVDMQLLEVAEYGTSPESRYRFHDLLRVFARERLREEEPEPARRAAIESVLRAYLEVAERAYAEVEPGDVYDNERAPTSWWPAEDAELVATLLQDPVRWFALERPSLIVAIEQAYQNELWELTYRLAIALYGSFSVGAHWHAWQRVYHRALDAARQDGNKHAEAKVMLRLGDVYKNSGRVDGPGGAPERDREDVIAADWLEKSRVAFHQLGARRREAAVLRRLGGVYRDLGRFDHAEACYKEGLALAGTLVDGDLVKAYLLRGYGALHRMAGRHDEAVACFDEALTVLHRLGDVRGELGGLRGLGETYLQQGRWEDAEACFERHLAVDREIGDRHAEAHSLRGLGEVRSGQRRYQEAVAYFEQCLPLFREIGHRSSEAETLGSLGLALLGLGRPNAARTVLRQSLAVFDELGMPNAHIRERLAESDRLGGLATVVRWAMGRPR